VVTQYYPHKSVLKHISYPDTDVFSLSSPLQRVWKYSVHIVTEHESGMVTSLPTSVLCCENWEYRAYCFEWDIHGRNYLQKREKKRCKLVEYNYFQNAFIPNSHIHSINFEIYLLRTEFYYFVYKSSQATGNKLFFIIFLQ
jgi:hypothetical protein